MGRDEETEEPTVVFTFHQTDYYTFLATNANLNKTLPSGKTIKEKYVPFDNLDNVVPFLANGFGIVLVLITSDEHIILTKRSSMSGRSEEHTSELQSRGHLVCRLLLEKKKKNKLK